VTFLWPYALVLMLAVPALAGAYLVLRRRKAESALRYVDASVLREALAGMRLARAHTPAMLMLAALAVLLLSVARPALVTTLPAREGTVILLMDVSLSMAAADVAPTRLDAAKAAAKAFIEGRPPYVRVGVVAFGGHADLVQPPTTDRVELARAIDELELQRFTAIGAGIVGALLTFFPDLDVSEGYDLFGIGRAPERKDARVNRRVVPAGSDGSRAIVLVSDGRSTMGIPAVTAAKIAAQHGIRIYTAGVGTLYGGIANVDGWAPIHAEFEEATLKKIADLTQADYFYARDVERLTHVYERLSTRLVFDRRETEVTAFFVAAAAVLALAAAALSFVWYNWPA